MRSNKIVNLGVPTDINEAATKGYVDTAVSNAVSGITPSETTTTEDTL